MGLLYYNNKNGNILVIKCDNIAILDEDKKTFPILNSVNPEDISIIEFEIKDDIHPDYVENNTVIYKKVLTSVECENIKLKQEKAELMYQLMMSQEVK